MKTFIGGVIVCLAVTAVPQWATALDDLSGNEAKKDKRVSREALFDQLDANNDGTLATDEVPKEHRRLFKRLLRSAGKDENGQLTSEEFKVGLRGKPQKRERGERPRRDRKPDAAQIKKRFEKMDTDGNGKVTADEVPEQRREFFTRMLKRIDKDGDGAATLEEFQAGSKAFAARGSAGKGPAGKGRPRRGPKGRPDDRRPGQGPPHGPGPGHPLMGLLDKDHDHKLSADEIAAAPEVLGKLDKNGDGELSVGELMHGGGGPQRRERGGPGEGRRPDVSKIVARIMKADENGDGKLSEDEMPDRLRERFAAIDADSDGFVTEKELKKRLSQRIKQGADGNRKKRAKGDQKNRKRKQNKKKKDKKDDEV